MAVFPFFTFREAFFLSTPKRKSFRIDDSLKSKEKKQVVSYVVVEKDSGDGGGKIEEV